MSRCAYKHFNPRAKAARWTPCGCSAMRNIAQGRGYNPRFCYQHQPGRKAKARRRQSAIAGGITRRKLRDDKWAGELKRYNSRGGRR